MDNLSTEARAKAGPHNWRGTMPASTPTLSDMVKEALDRGQTYDQLAERAIDPDSGEKASRGLLYDLSRGTVRRVPTEGHLRAVAIALGKPYETVRRAAIAQWLPAEDGASTEEELRSELRRMRESAERIEKRLDAIGEQDAARTSA